MIWRQAGIYFEIVGGGVTVIPRLDLLDVEFVDRDILMDHPARDPNDNSDTSDDGFEIYFVNSFERGLGIMGHRGRWVASHEGILIDQEGLLNGRTVAHELGHALGKPPLLHPEYANHPARRVAIMCPAWDGSGAAAVVDRADITAEEAESARTGRTK
ncbi:MAG: hypothetical protein HQ559_06070 [Lentisphaerae bacterium]|nr:hypothetical protein [Lentisphaerota bacterium]